MYAYTQIHLTDHPVELIIYLCHKRPWFSQITAVLENGNKLYWLWGWVVTTANP